MAVVVLGTALALDVAMPVQAFGSATFAQLSEARDGHRFGPRPPKRSSTYSHDFVGGSPAQDTSPST